jgi:hypothetical protein
MADLEPTSLPTAEFAWKYLRAHCHRKRKDNKPIYTLIKKIPNYISHVGDEEIRRTSTGSREGKNNTNVSLTLFRTLWTELRNHGSVSYAANRFALALLCDAFPDLIEHADGAHIIARIAPVFVFTPSESFISERQEQSRRWPPYRNYNEGFEHWVTKHYIAE